MHLWPFNLTHLLEGIDRTYIVTNIAEKHYQASLQKYGLDPNRFQYVNDQELIDAYPEILNWDQTWGLSRNLVKAAGIKDCKP